ncbi:MAG: hypothetical protein M1814_002995 [Vezdaea aestivalis]|nr:MAG: hypothetical protein M1814_002995 [Vezdaea aestivalis]
MAKKRKASSQLNGGAEYNKKEKLSSRLGPINTFEDVADSEDEFHINRDKILLDRNPRPGTKGPSAEELLELSDEEVFAFSDDDSNEDSDLDDQANESYGATINNVQPFRGREGAEDSASEEEREDADEGLGGWGSSKTAYYSNDAIETEADALEEEEEAKRLQHKKLQAMTDADFGVDLSEWQNDSIAAEIGVAKDGKGRSNKLKATVTEVLPEIEITTSMTEEERLEILHTRYPEFEPLGAEMIELQPVQKELAEHRKQQRLRRRSDDQFPLTRLKFNAVSSYLGALALYFALLTSPAARKQIGLGPQPATMLSASSVRDHPIMEAVLQARTVWHQVKDMPIPITETDIPPTPSPEPAPVEVTTTLVAQKTPRKRLSKREKQQLKEAKEAAAATAKKRAMLQAEFAAISKPRPETGDLPKSILKRPVMEPPSAFVNDDLGDYGDEAPLTGEAAAARAAQRKSLRFYTSQIESTEARRNKATKSSGDTDLPYKERWFEKQQRLKAAAEQREKRLGTSKEKAASTVDMDDDEQDDGEGDSDGEGKDEDEQYYDMIAHQSKAKKQAKAETASLAQQAARGEFIQEETVDGKRGITYVIEKNKGLTPHRKKEVRNPRVKKRNKYAQKMKKLGSVRKLYKGGEGRGGYGGEATGIKRRLVRSVKL